MVVITYTSISRIDRFKTKTLMLLDFSLEVLLEIVRLLSFKDVCRLSQTCRALRSFCLSDDIWRPLCEEKAAFLSYSDFISQLPKDERVSKMITLNANHWYYLSFRSFFANQRYRGIWSYDDGCSGLQVFVNHTFYAKTDPDLCWVCSTQFYEISATNDLAMSNSSLMPVGENVREATGSNHEVLFWENLRPKFNLILRSQRTCSVKFEPDANDSCHYHLRACEEGCVLAPDVSDLSMSSAPVEMGSPYGCRLFPTEEAEFAVDKTFYMDEDCFPTFTIPFRPNGKLVPIRKPPTRNEMKKYEGKREIRVKDLTGIFVGDYGSHGVEFLYVYVAYPSSSESTVTPSTDHILRAVKLTGDENVPKGETSFFVELTEETANVRFSNWTGEVHPLRGYGQLSDTGFEEPWWSSLDVFFSSPDEFIVTWWELSAACVFKRLYLEDLEDVARETRLKESTPGLYTTSPCGLSVETKLSVDLLPQARFHLSSPITSIIYSLPSKIKIKSSFDLRCPEVVDRNLDESAGHTVQNGK
ncbi:hypothetical protein PROFUN_02508 [Planoprotostelium fungivorum]|uniref:F-box domain-containing protein n=1 Tax=Planoprotostelium fungivorum TaxID=1890364 RepID=A0A2P6MP55_9EUKA|nr:hypothetical protein PROFUN_02508 [Planoprotostelium fungivorum]